MNCDGIDSIERLDRFGERYLPVEPVPMCDVTLSRDLPCPRPRASSSLLALGLTPARTASWVCGAVRVTDDRIGQSESEYVTRWFDGVSYTQTGWQWTPLGSDVTLCGGVVPPRDCGIEPSRCLDDQQPQLCECPSPSCEVPPCPNYSECAQDADCISGYCYKGPDGQDAPPWLCQAALHCTNGTADGVESDVDCGGLACPACRGGQRCNIHTDCQSQSCTGGVCDLIDLCKDGVASAFETDVDCGDEFCNPCQAGQRCLAGTDCASGSCAARVCDAVAP